MDQPCSAPPRPASEKTSEKLLARARGGDSRAVSALIRRYLPSLRQAVPNQIRDDHRRFERRGAHDALAETLPDPGLSPFDEASHGEVKRRYSAALARLRPADQELVVAHLELGYSHDQLGCMTGKRTNSARMALRRALDRLAEAMRDA